MSVPMMGSIIVTLAALLSGICTCTAWDRDKPAMVGNLLLTLLFAGMAVSGWIEVAG